MRSPLLLLLTAASFSGCDAVLNRAQVQPSEADINAIRTASGCASASGVTFKGPDDLDLTLATSGDISDGDCPFKVNVSRGYFTSPAIADAYGDFYALKVAQGASYDIKMNSSTFDAHLWLFEKDGTYLGEDDDSNGGTNARLQMHLSPGIYLLVAASNRKTERGSYSLKGTAKGRF